MPKISILSTITNVQKLGKGVQNLRLCINFNTNQNILKILYIYFKINLIEIQIIVGG